MLNSNYNVSMHEYAIKRYANARRLFNVWKREIAEKISTAKNIYLLKLQSGLQLVQWFVIRRRQYEY